MTLTYFCEIRTSSSVMWQTRRKMEDEESAAKNIHISTPRYIAPGSCGRRVIMTRPETRASTEPISTCTPSVMAMVAIC